MECDEARKSASKWEQASERALVAIWKEKVVNLRRCRKNSHILEEMAAEMHKQGFSYTAPEIKTKMHNMTTRFRKEKQQIGPSGGSPSEWDLFSEMQMIFTPYKSYNTESLVQDSINSINSIIEVTSPIPSPLSSPISSTPSTAMFDTSSDPSTAMSPSSSLPSSSKPKIKKKDSLNHVPNKVEMNIEKIQDEMQKTSQKIIEIEEEKKNMLKEKLKYKRP